MYPKRRGRPIPRRVAVIAIHRQVERRVVRVRRLVKIHRVAGRAIRRRALKTVRVAVDALSRFMPAVQHKIRRVVVKNKARIALRMAGKTGRAVVIIAIYPRVVVVGLRVLVAGRAGEFPKIGRVLMAFRTI